eukprot:8156044-Pyramimonas_sp.AAC.2
MSYLHLNEKPESMTPKTGTYAGGVLHGAGGGGPQPPRAWLPHTAAHAATGGCPPRASTCEAGGVANALHPAAGGGGA